VIDHGRRKLLHFNVTEHPTADWVIQQLRETFSGSARHRYVILDRDAKFSQEVLDLLEASGIKPVRTRRAQSVAEMAPRNAGWKRAPRLFPIT